MFQRKISFLLGKVDLLKIEGQKGIKRHTLMQN